MAACKKRSYSGRSYVLSPTSSWSLLLQFPGAAAWGPGIRGPSGAPDRVLPRFPRRNANWWGPNSRVSCPAPGLDPEEDNGDAPAQLPEGNVRDVQAVYADAAVGAPQDPEEGQCQGGLSGAGSSHHANLA
ncbi:unnamed protein product [Ixodes pacificus]